MERFYNKVIKTALKGGVRVRALMFNPAECTGCMSCQLICSFNRLKLYNPEKAVLRVAVRELDEPSITYCRHCKEPACIEACSFDAMTIEDGVVIINNEKCTGCGLCAESCPYGAIFIENSIAVKCDQCKGLFNCTKVCTTGAISVIEK
jgi:Fe-S-cluster-containing hydrogenase component 2